MGINYSTYEGQYTMQNKYVVHKVHVVMASVMWFVGLTPSPKVLVQMFKPQCFSHMPNLLQGDMSLKIITVA